MKRLVPAAALISISLPALGATHAVLRDAGTPIETVQFQHTPQQNQRHQPRRYHGAYNAYGSAKRAPASNSSANHDVIPGWPCVYRDVGEGYYSAIPAWEICN